MTTAYLDARLPNIERNLDGIDGPISAMLERTYGVRIARVEQRIQAIALSKRHAKLLKAKAGSPALLATRRFYGEDGTLIELSSAIHPSDRFSYVTNLVR
jgi:DNA-binding GntR family transcriptional regulator